MILLHCVISDGRFAVFGLGLLPVLSSEVLFGISCLFSLFLVLIEARIEAAACFTCVGGSSEQRPHVVAVRVKVHHSEEVCRP